MRQNAIDDSAFHPETDGSRGHLVPDLPVHIRSSRRQVPGHDGKGLVMTASAGHIQAGRRYPNQHLRRCSCCARSQQVAVSQQQIEISSVTGRHRLLRVIGVREEAASRVLSPYPICTYDWNIPTFKNEDFIITATCIGRAGQGVSPRAGR